MSDTPSGERFAPLVARLHALHPQVIDLSLDRVTAVLARLGNPERALPPLIHVAGTNGKGSTCAFIRAMAEAAGQRVHAFTSPHLVRFNERIVLAGSEVTDDALEAALAEVEGANDGAAITVFEVLTAAALLLFARTPADLAVIEVGLGGRLDATNVIPAPAAVALTSISLDHREWLGETVEAIAAEKAGIIKPGTVAVTGAQGEGVLDVFSARAAESGAALRRRDRDWTLRGGDWGLRFADAAGAVDIPCLSLPGAHQADNAGIALATLRATGLPHDPRGLARAAWPGRLQLLTGRLAARLPPKWELWLDGGHNPGAGRALADQARVWADQALHVVVGMKAGKNLAGFLRPILPYATTLWAVAEPGQHLAAPVEAIVAASGGSAQPAVRVRDALDGLAAGGPPARVLICGSLYLAGRVLAQDVPGLTAAPPNILPAP